MALNFPGSPSTNDTYSLGSKTWTFNGDAWELTSVKTGYTGSAGGGGGSVTVVDDTTTNANFYPVLAPNGYLGSLATVDLSKAKLYYNPSTGTFNSTSFNSLSDERLKTNIQLISDAIALVNMLQGVEFTWIDSGRPSAGVLAQHIESVVPHLVETDGGGVKSVNYSAIIPYLIEAIKQLDIRVRTLENGYDF